MALPTLFRKRLLGEPSETYLAASTARSGKSTGAIAQLVSFFELDLRRVENKDCRSFSIFSTIRSKKYGKAAAEVLKEMGSAR